MKSDQYTEELHSEDAGDVEVVGYRWLDTANFRKDIPAGGNESEWDALGRISDFEHTMATDRAEIERLRDAYQGAMEDKAAWKKHALEAEEKVRVYDKETEKLRAELAEVRKDAELPQCVRDWYAAKLAHANAVDAYNARLDFIKKHMKFGTSVDPEYQIMEAADRKARELLYTMFLGLKAIDAALSAQQENKDE